MSYCHANSYWLTEHLHGNLKKYQQLQKCVGMIERTFYRASGFFYASVCWCISNNAEFKKSDKIRIALCVHPSASSSFQLVKKAALICTPWHRNVLKNLTYHVRVNKNRLNWTLLSCLLTAYYHIALSGLLPMSFACEAQQDQINSYYSVYNMVRFYYKIWNTLSVLALQLARCN